MKKRMLALFMCVIMLISAFTLSACSDEVIDDPDEDLEEQTPVITIYGIKEPGTTDEAIAAVEKALSEISYRKHGVNIDLLLFEEAEYASVIFNKAQSAMNAYNSELQKTSEYNELVNTEVDFSTYNKDTNPENDLQIAESVPQELTSARMDIFLVYNPKADSEALLTSPGLANGGMFQALYEQKAILGLDTYLNNGNYSTLKTTAYPDALEALKRITYATLLKEDKKYDTYGVPNNIVCGEYEFMLFDDKYIGDLWPDDMSKDVIVKYEDGGDSEALKSFEKELMAKKEAGEIAENVEIRKDFNTYEEYNQYVRDGGEFCIATVKGGISVELLCSQSGEYEVHKRGTSDVTAATICESMFCISPSARQRSGKTMNDNRVKKVIDVLILLNTDAEFRNIFQYGIRDTHYTLGRDGVARITGTKKNTYIMNPLYSGNMFIIHPSDRMTVEMQKLAENNWYLGKKQVNEMIDAYKAK